MIRLQQKNQELRSRIKTADLQVTDFLNRIHTDFTFENASFFCTARVKSKNPPQTLGFVSLLQNDSQFVFLILNGFKKDFATLAVELLFEQYAAGYMDATEESGNDSFPIQSLLEKLMERFSPDIYNVAFSFAIGRLIRDERRLDFYGIRQDLPAVANRDGKCIEPESKVLEFTGKFAGLIKAETVVLPKGASFCMYRKGIQTISNETYQNTFVPSFKNHETVSSLLLNAVFDQLPDSEEDQLISILHIK